MAGYFGKLYKTHEGIRSLSQLLCDRYGHIRFAYLCCDCMELQMLFYLSIKERGYNCSQAILNDFIKTCERLKDFCFRFTDKGIEYFDLGNEKNMTIYNGCK